MEKNNKLTLMVLNENNHILISMLSAFKKHCQVKTFNSGLMALKYLSHNVADLILVGNKTSDLSGHEVLDKLQSDNSTRMVPAIFLSSPSDENSGLQALAKGAVDYILEPIEPHILLKRIYLHLKLRNLRRHLEFLVEEKSTDLNSPSSKSNYVRLNLLMQITSLLDSETGEHIKRTAEYARILVNFLLDQPHPDYSLTELEAIEIVNAAKLHDLGKLIIPNQLLHKPAKLNNAEFEVVKQHSIRGAKLLNSVLVKLVGDSFLKKVYEIALYHHEKWNGLGYPENLRENVIPISARIIAIADVYDALTHSRSYRAALSHSQAVEIIEKESGKHFDPHLVKVFLNNHQEFKHALICA